MLGTAGGSAESRCWLFEALCLCTGGQQRDAVSEVDVVHGGTLGDVSRHTQVASLIALANVRRTKHAARWFARERDGRQQAGCTKIQLVRRQRVPSDVNRTGSIRHVCLLAFSPLPRHYCNRFVFSKPFDSQLIHVLLSKSWETRTKDKDATKRSPTDTARTYVEANSQRLLDVCLSVQTMSVITDFPHELFSAFEAEGRGSVKGDTVTRIKSSTAFKREALNWRAVFSSCCVYLWDFQRRPYYFIGGMPAGRFNACPLTSFTRHLPCEKSDLPGVSAPLILEWLILTSTKTQDVARWLQEPSSTQIPTLSSVPKNTKEYRSKTAACTATSSRTRQQNGVTSQRRVGTVPVGSLGNPSQRAGTAPFPEPCAANQRTGGPMREKRPQRFTSVNLGRRFCLSPMGSRVRSPPQPLCGFSLRGEGVVGGGAVVF
ncbi:hypothetical protein PR048_022945 [Dryococelus australis]|uniref:Uncharacterized protein n=1 Tax=Dryococelus australis TaxID=614101 RepID=A0ABQ9GSS3_9NEOP|nr:hypothetical protein PR048_022945 [Dryococelus australis]